MNEKPTALPTIGLIGLGNLGNPMAVSALTNGYKMVVHSLKKNEADNPLAPGATWDNTTDEIGPTSALGITVFPPPTHLPENSIPNRGVHEKMKQ